MGMMLLGFLWFVLLYILYQPCKFLAPESKFANAMYGKMDRALFWGGQILYVQEAYLDILISVLINIIYFSGEPAFSWEVVFSGFVTLILAIAVVVLPIFLCVYIIPNYDKLQDAEYPWFQQKYLPIYEMLVQFPEPPFTEFTPRSTRSKALTRFYSKQDLDLDEVSNKVDTDLGLAKSDPEEMTKQCKLLNNQFE